MVCIIRRGRLFRVLAVFWFGCEYAAVNGLWLAYILWSPNQYSKKSRLEV